jgi:hypothetical protein
MQRCCEPRPAKKCHNLELTLMYVNWASFVRSLHPLQGHGGRSMAGGNCHYLLQGHVPVLTTCHYCTRSARAGVGWRGGIQHQNGCLFSHCSTSHCCRLTRQRSLSLSIHRYPRGVFLQNYWRDGDDFATRVVHALSWLFSCIHVIM